MPMLAILVLSLLFSGSFAQVAFAPCLDDVEGTCVRNVDDSTDEYTSLSLLQRHAALITLENPVATAPASVASTSAVAEPATKEQVWQAWAEWDAWLNWLWEESWWTRLWYFIGITNYFTNPENFDTSKRRSIPFSFVEMLRYEWWSIVLIVGSAVTLISLLHARIKHTELQENARSCGYVMQLLNFLAFSVVIIDSYQVALMVNGGITYSGAIIGIYMAGSGVGYVLSWTLLTLYPESWRTRTRQVLTTANFIGLIGSVGYLAIVGMAATSSDVPSSFKVVLLIFRVCNGLSQGLTALFNRVVFVRLTKAEERVFQSVRYSFFTQLGMGCGPLVAAVAQIFNSPTEYPEMGIVHVCVVSAGAQLIAVIIMVFMYPNISSCRDEVAMQDGGPDAERNDPNSWTKKRIVLTCVCVITLMSYITSGLESLTSIALETMYHWKVTDVGLIVAFTYLLAVPVIIAFVWLKESWRPVSWAFAICVVQFFGTAFLYPFPFFNSGWCLVLSDSVVFPLMTVGTGLFIGQMDMFKFPEGTLFNVNNRTLCSGIMTNGVARLFGPITARFLFAQAGMLGYAIQQSSCIFVVFALFLSMRTTFGNPILDPSSEAKDASSAKKVVS